MNREILFRAWAYHPVEGKYVMYGPEMIRNNSLRYVTDSNTYPDPTIMQFTGLHDKNGTQIFEGDVLFIDHFGGRRVQVEFKSGCFYTIIGTSKYRVGGWKIESIEVIGDIFSNPELLTQ